MGCWGYNSDQNDNVQDIIASFEFSEDHFDESERSSYHKFEKLIDLEELKTYSDENILGVLVNYTRPDSVDILAGGNFESGLPTELPSNYPESYKKLALEVLGRIEIPKDPEFAQALKKEKKLFGNE